MEKSAKIKLQEQKEETPSSKIFWAFMYLLLIIVVLFSACFIYDRTYYTPFYVVGRSMAPTLNNSEIVNNGFYEYGIVDEHKMVLKTLKRYDLVITYYTNDYEDSKEVETQSNEFVPAFAASSLKPNSGAKIKRVIGLPNETVTIKNELDENKNKINKIYITSSEKDLKGEIHTSTDELKLPFTPIDKFGLAAAVAEHNNKKTHDIGDYLSITLGDDDFFVMGDNWGHSDDSTSLNVGPIKSEFILGAVIKIQGKVKIHSNKVTERVEYKHDEVRYYKQ